MRLLLAREYRASVGLRLGPEAAAAALPPADPTLGGFDVTAAVQLPLSPVQVEDYERSARAVAQATVDHPATLAARHRQRHGAALGRGPYPSVDVASALMMR